MKKILIIDDDRELSNLIKAYLRYHGYGVRVVNDARQGIVVAKKNQPDLILLDVLMPAMNGREVCRKLKKDEKTKNIPVFFLTAKDSPDDIDGEFEAGGAGHLTKPFDIKELLEKIRKLVVETNWRIVE